MKLHRGCVVFCLVLLSTSYAPWAVAEDDGKVAPKWVGLCVKIDPQSKLISEAILEVSSGDPELDEDLRKGSIGVPGPIHAPLGEWLELRAASPEAGSEAAEADDLPLPDMSCARFNAPSKPH